MNPSHHWIQPEVVRARITVHDFNTQDQDAYVRGSVNEEQDKMPENCYYLHYKSSLYCNQHES
jgi:hypothetical protein